MKTCIFTAAHAVLLATVCSFQAFAADRMIAGDEAGAQLISTGFTDTVTSPAKIIEEVGQDTSNFGVGGVLTGIPAGSVKAAGQALQGGGRILIGILDVLTAPIRESRYNRHGPGSLR